MKANLGLLLSLCLVLVNVSFGDDNGNTDTQVTPKARDANTGKKSERMFPKLANINRGNWCRGHEKEDDGTPCSGWVGLIPYTGICKGGWCVPDSSRISARSGEPTEESAEPTEESPVPAEETPERVTYWTVD